jgi:hypothetical protein
MRHDFDYVGLIMGMDLTLALIRFANLNFLTLDSFERISVGSCHTLNTFRRKFDVKNLHRCKIMFNVLDF